MTDFSRSYASLPSWLPLLIVGSALCLLMALGVWSIAGAFNAYFWRDAGLSLSVLVVAGVLLWKAAVPSESSAAHQASPAMSQTVAYLATLCGLLLVVVIIWLQVTSGSMPGALTSSVGTVAMRRLGLREVNAILLLSVAAYLLLLPAEPTTQPLWLFSALATGVSLFAGQAALQMLRRPGVAVMVFAAVLFYQALANFALAQTAAAVAANGEAPSAAAQFLALAPAAAMDAIYMLRLPDADARPTLWLAMAAGIAVSFSAEVFFLVQLSGSASLASTAIVRALMASAVVGLWCGWCGAQFGRWRASGVLGSA
jgi:hypothetical protein